MSPECHHLSSDVTMVEEIQENKFVELSKKDRQDIIIEVIEKGIKFRIKHLERIFGVNSRTIKRDLKELKDKDLSEFVGNNVTVFINSRKGRLV